MSSSSYFIYKSYFDHALVAIVSTKFLSEEFARVFKFYIKKSNKKST